MNPLTRFIKEKNPDRRVATQAFRQVFAGMFAAQFGIALLTALLVILLAGVQARPSPLGPTLAGLSVLQLLLGLIVPEMAAGGSGKGPVLSALLLSSVILAGSSWTLMLAVVTGQEFLHLAIIGFMMANAYLLGFLQAGRLAAKATRREPQEPA